MNDVKEHIINEQTITVHTKELDEKAPLFYQYATQHNPQPARIELNPEDRTVCAGINYNIGNGDSADIWFNRTIAVSVSPYVSGNALIEFMNDEDTLLLVDKIFAGHSIDDNNKGRLTEEAHDAWYRLESLAENIDHMEVWECGDWLEKATTYFDKDGKQCDHDDAVRAEIYNVDMVEHDSNAAVLAHNTEEWIDADIHVYGIERHYEELIAHLKENKEQYDV